MSNETGLCDGMMDLVASSPVNGELFRRSRMARAVGSGD